MDRTETQPIRTALQLGAQLARGEIDAEAVAAATLAAIEAAHEPGLFTRVSTERARAEAKAAAQRLGGGTPASPLDGVPIAWKDLFDLEGQVTTAGARVMEAEPAAKADAPVVAALKAAGMVCVGRTGMTEFAFSGLGLNPHYGTPRNPYGTADDPRIPGGSSSGSAVAVAMGLVPVAIGSDTGGSVRIPAAFNGIVGYKSTHGRYPMQGVFPLSVSLDSLGTFTHDVSDAIAVDAAMRGTRADVKAIAPKELTLIVPTNIVFDDAEPAVVENFERALASLAAAGARIERRVFMPFSDVTMLINNNGPLVTAEAYQVHAKRLASPAATAMDPRVAARMRIGAKISVANLTAIDDGRERFIADARAVLGPRVMLAHPTVPHVAPRLRPLEADDDLYVRTNGRTLRNTTLGNLLGFCGVSMPCGRDADGMPVGFLLSAAGKLDADVLGAALGMEDLVRGG